MNNHLKNKQDFILYILFTAFLFIFSFISYQAVSDLNKVYANSKRFSEYNKSLDSVRELERLFFNIRINSITYWERGEEKNKNNIDLLTPKIEEHIIKTKNETTNVKRKTTIQDIYNSFKSYVENSNKAWVYKANYQNNHTEEALEIISTALKTSSEIAVNIDEIVKTYQSEVSHIEEYLENLIAKEIKNIKMEASFGLLISLFLFYFLYLILKQKKENVLKIKDFNKKQQTLNKVLDALNAPFDKSDGIENITSLIKKEFEYDAVAVRLKSENDYKYYTYQGFDLDFIKKENSVFNCEESPDKCEACLCGMVINQKETIPFFTKNHSLVVDDLDFDLNEYIEKIPNFRGTCQKVGYRSLALIPIFVGDEIRGILQVNNKDANKLSNVDIEFLEKIATSLGVAINRKNMEENLIKAKSKAEKAGEAKASFLANMSHEIRTPMNAVLGIAQLLERTELNNKQYDYVKKINVAGHSLLYLINDILDFSKIEKGKFELSKINFNLDDALRNLATILAMNSRGKNIEVLFDIDQNIPKKLIGDPQRLEQVLINISSNAVKFTKNGEVVLSVKEKSIKNDKVNLLFSVKDTGVGISKENIEKIFIPFEQEDASISRNFGGTGLGLSISKKIVKLMGGDLKVESELGKGSNFTFNAIFEFEDKKENTPKEIISTLHKLNVLIVDDNDVACHILETIISSFGWNYRTCFSGKDALEEFSRNKRYDLVLMDIKMPEMNGIETTKAIKELSKHNLPKIIAVTATDLTEIEDQKLFDGFLIKPSTSSMILDEIVNSFNNEIKRSKSNIIIDDKKLTGVNILLVEDNEINVEIAKELLEKNGSNVETAENGLIALEKFNNNFDIVLMDIHMPKMNGYEATKKIRMKNKEIPIIAMSADVIEESVKKCFDAGMNEHIAKPINASKMFETILKFVQTKNVVIEEEKQEVDDWYKSMQEFDDFDKSIALEWTSYDKQSLLKMLNLFNKKYFDASEKLDNLFKENKTTELMEFAHSIKGVSGTLGAKNLSKAMGDIEDTVNSEQFETLKNKVKYAKKCLNISLNSFKSIVLFLDSIENSETKPINNQDLKTKLDNLKKLLEDKNLDSDEAFEEIKDALSKERIINIDELADKINNMDYFGALTLIKDIKW